MKTLFLLFLFCHVSSPVKHTLKFFFTASSGVPNFPELVATIVVDEILAGYCDTNTKTIKPKQDWMEKVFEDDPQHLEHYNRHCSENDPVFFKTLMDSLKQSFNHSGGIHILQRMNGCEWDDETGEVNVFVQYGYDGDFFLVFDVKTETWIASKPQAITTKQIWDKDKDRITDFKKYLTQIFPGWLKKYVAYGNSTLLRKDLPSVSLLQKTPSSPVSCHATGFYPDRATMFWRKDGEDLHEDVDLGEILPNNDGSFQMSVDLNLSSVTPEDWRRYDCVFQLSGVKDDLITTLDKAKIRTNWGKTNDMTFAITAAVVVFVLALILFIASGFIAYKMKKAKCPPSYPHNSSELSNLSK